MLKRYVVQQHFQRTISLEITTPFLEYQFLYIQCFQMNAQSFEAKYKFKLKFKCEKIYNLKKFERSFSFSSNLLFRSTFHRHCDLHLEIENLLLHSMYFVKNMSCQLCTSNHDAILAKLQIRHDPALTPYFGYLPIPSRSFVMKIRVK